MKMKIGKYNVTAKIKIVGLTESAKEDFNKLLAKEEGKNDNHKNAMTDKRAKEEIITAMELSLAFIVPIWGGFYLIAKVMG